MPSKSPAIRMAPLYRDGDMLIVSPTASIRKGDRVVVCTTDGEILAKELRRRSAKSLELVSLDRSSEDRDDPHRGSGLDRPHHVGAAVRSGVGSRADASRPFPLLQESLVLAHEFARQRLCE